MLAMDKLVLVAARGWSQAILKATHLNSAS